MKLSWSHKLFLKINNTLGKRPWLDKIMYFCGQWLIFLMIGVVCVDYFYAFGFYIDRFIFLFFVNIIFAYVLSYGIAFLVRRPRPIRELPNVKELIIPIETWKSFPSDHTIMVTLVFLYATEFASEFVFYFLSVAVPLVMFGRVYCGVHYPRDILGGIFTALLSYFICSEIYFLLFPPTVVIL